MSRGADACHMPARINRKTRGEIRRKADSDRHFLGALVIAVVVFGLGQALIYAFDITGATAAAITMVPALMVVGVILGRLGVI